MPDDEPQRPGGTETGSGASEAGTAETAPYQPGSEPTAPRSDAPATPRGRLREGETLIGRFVIRRFIARGGMGEVYEAEDTVLRTRVALKTLLPSLSEHPGSIERFRREVLLARSIAHPNVCRVFDLHSTQVDDGPLHFLTMEFLEGESLASRLKTRGAMDPVEALPLVRQMAAALDAAHAQGVVHRDFKPGNVLLVTARGPGAPTGVRAVVTDFGIARATAQHRNEFETTGGTGTEEFLGTPDYAAPEQVSKTGAITEATDVFALGVVLYQLVTGELPFPGDTPFDAMVRRLRDRPRAPRRLRRGLDPAWNAAILHCLEKDPKDRPRSAAEVVAELEGKPAPSPRRPGWRVPAVVLACVVLAGGFLLLRRDRRSAGALTSRTVYAVLSPAAEVPPADSWVGPALMALLTRELEQAPGIRVLPWRRVVAAYPSLALDTDQVLDEEQRGRLYDLLPADRFIDGRLRCAPDATSETCQLRVTLRDSDGSSRRVVERSFAPFELSAVASNLGAELRETPAPSGAQTTQGGGGTALLRLLGQGVAAYGRFDFEAARESLQSAASLEPGSFDVQWALSQVEERLGLFAAARKSASLAAAAALGSEAKAAAGARVEWLGGDLGRATTAYRELLQLHPDDVETALALSRRLPSAEGLALLGPMREWGRASGDLSLALRVAQLEQDLHHDDDARRTWADLLTSVQRLRARRELSLVTARSSVQEAEKIALAVGDRQRAAYLHLASTGDNYFDNETGQKLADESAARFAALGDRIGIHYSLLQKALAEKDWASSHRTLESALAELSGAGERPSSRAHLVAAEVFLHLGDLRSARGSLESAMAVIGAPSIDLVADIPPVLAGALRERGGRGFPVSAPSRSNNFRYVEIKLLVEEGRLDEAESRTKELLRRPPEELGGEEEGSLCWLQCARGDWEGGAHCYERLLGTRARSNPLGWGLAECYWSGGDLQRAQRAAFASQHFELMPAVQVTMATGGSEEGRTELMRLTSLFHQRHDVLQELRVRLLLGAAELRSNPIGASQVVAWAARGRRRVEEVLGEAKHRNLPLLVQQAQRELDRANRPPAGSKTPRP